MTLSKPSRHEDAIPARPISGATPSRSGPGTGSYFSAAVAAELRRAPRTLDPIVAAEIGTLIGDLADEEGHL